MNSRVDNYETHLSMFVIDSTADAGREIGNVKINHHLRTKEIPILLRPAGGDCKCWVAVPEGFVAIMTVHSRVIGVWDAGHHYCSPLAQIAYLVPEQYIVWDSPVKQCPTADNVFVEIDVALVFHVQTDSKEKVQKFVYDCGAQTLERILGGAVEEAVRGMALQKEWRDIYDLMDTEDFEEKAARVNQYRKKKPAAGNVTDEKTGLLQGDGVEMDNLAQQTPVSGGGDESDDDPFDEALEQLANTKRNLNKLLHAFGVEVVFITITNVRFADRNIQQQMESATTQEAMRRHQDETQKLTMRRQANSDETSRMIQESKELLAQRNAEFITQITKLREEVALIKSQTSREVAKIEEETKAKELQVRTDSKLEVAKVNRAMELALANMRAETDASIQDIQSKNEAWKATMVAQTEAKVAPNDAQALACKAEAEAVRSKSLVHRRDFEAKMAHLRALNALANNKNVVISGDNKDNVLAQLLASQRASGVISLNGSNN